MAPYRWLAELGPLGYPSVIPCATPTFRTSSSQAPSSRSVPAPAKRSRLQSDFASEGLALVRDADGYVVEAIAGANAQTNSVHVFDLRQAFGSGAQTNVYPILVPVRTWRTTDLFPRWIAGQNLRDVTAITTATGYELAGLGRVFYNTAPRATTQISIRELRNNGTVLGPAREIPVDLPEQEFSGFIKHADSRTDLSVIGAGAYDSGQGSVGGLSYAQQQPNGSWTRLLQPPSFGDITAPRLPRDTAYSCPDGTSWVCIPPVGNVGVWSTERVGGGGVRFGNTVMFIAMAIAATVGKAIPSAIGQKIERWRTFSHTMSQRKR